MGLSDVHPMGILIYHVLHAVSRPNFGAFFLNVQPRTANEPAPQKIFFFPTYQVRVVRFYASWLPPSASSGPQPRPSTPSVPCRTSTARIHAKIRQVFPAGPQPRPSTPCRTSTATIHAKCSLPDLNRRRECQKICQIECQIERQIECQIECQRRMPDKNAR